MSKGIFLAYVILFSISSNLTAQSVQWEYQTNNTIYRYNHISDRVLLIHGESNGTKVVRAIRKFPSVTAIDNNTGKKVWEIKNPVDMMGASDREKNQGTVKVELGFVKKDSDLVRFGHLMVVDSKDGTIVFNPTKEGITNIMHSKVFPEGILATAMINNKVVTLFLSFSSWKISWIEDSDIESPVTDKINNFLVRLSSSDENENDNFSQAIAESFFYNGKYISGNYVFRTEEGGITSINIEGSYNSSGGRGIRTLDTLAGITVFETVPFNRSGIPPVRQM